MSFKIPNFLECLQSGIKYLPTTIILTIVPVIVGLIVGTLIAIVRINKVRFWSKFFSGFVAFYNAVPFILSLMIINTVYKLTFDDFAASLGLSITIADIDAIWIGFFVLSLMNICHMSESIRGAFISIDKGQYEGGYSVGLTNRQTFLRIIIPQIVPIAIPILISNTIGIMKASAIVFTLGIFEIYNGCLLPCNRTYSFLEGYVSAAMIYWALTIFIEQVGKWIEKKGSKYRRNLA